MKVIIIASVFIIGSFINGLACNDFRVTMTQVITIIGFTFVLKIWGVK